MINHVIDVFVAKNTLLVTAKRHTNLAKNKNSKKKDNAINIGTLSMNCFMGK